MEEDLLDTIQILKQSKPISELKEDDILSLNGKKMVVISHFLFMDHKTTKEMIIQFLNPENKREYQLRYFDDQVETSLEVYELQGGFQYVKRQPKTIEW